MNLSIIAGIVAFLLLCFIFITTLIGGQEGAKEHFILRLLLVFFFLQLLIIIASDASNVCEFVGNFTDQENYYGNNFTAYHWEYPADPVPVQTQQLAYILHQRTENDFKLLCVDNQTNTSKAFLRLVYAINYAFWIYVLLYIIYAIMVKKGVIKTK